LNKSHIEITGIKAWLYDFLLGVGTLGFYPMLIKRVIKDMGIKKQDTLLDLGAGSGKNELRMLKYLSGGSITALEIGREMRKQFEKNCRNHKNVLLVNRRIEQPLPFNAKFDKVFISYVIHGFDQAIRETIVRNAYEALKNGGKLFIFDWNEFDLREKGIIINSFFRYVECKEALDFIQRDFKKLLAEIGFRNLEERLYAKNTIRLLIGEKKGDELNG